MIGYNNSELSENATTGVEWLFERQPKDTIAYDSKTEDERTRRFNCIRNRSDVVLLIVLRLICNINMLCWCCPYYCG